MAGAIGPERVSRRNFLADRHALARVHARRNRRIVLRRRLADETVRNLIDAGPELLQMDTVSASIGNVKEDAPRQLSLEVEVPLLSIGRLIISPSHVCQWGLLKAERRYIR